jgi:hypothetical protein
LLSFDSLRLAAIDRLGVLTAAWSEAGASFFLPTLLAGVVIDDIAD